MKDGYKAHIDMASGPDKTVGLVIGKGVSRITFEEFESSFLFPLGVQGLVMTGRRVEAEGYLNKFSPQAFESIVESFEAMSRAFESTIEATLEFVRTFEEEKK